MIHINAAARLNGLVKTNLGEANSLYMILYYLGAFTGSLWAILIFDNKGWNTLVSLSLVLLCSLALIARGKTTATDQR